MWTPDHRSGDAAIYESWSLLTSRVRDAARNDPAIRKILHQMVRLIVGTGIRTYSAVENPDGSDVEDYNDESDIWFHRWAEEEADAIGDMSLLDMERMSIQEVIECGNSLWIRTIQRRRNRISPLSYQLIEWEQLARERDRGGMDTKSRGWVNAIRNGIEYDRKNRKVAFHVYDAHPYEWSVRPDSRNITRIPAERVIHNYIAPRPSATSGITWFSAALLPSRDVDWYLGNELTSSAIAALLVMIHKSNNHGVYSGLDADEGQRNDPAKWGHATVAQVGQDDDVDVVQSQRPNSSSKDFIDLMNVRLSMACDLSVNRFLGDPSRANLASIKASHQDDAALAAPLQRHQGRRISRPIRLQFTDMAVATGLFQNVSATQYMRQRHKFRALDIAYPGTGEVQTEKEAPAAIDRMRSGLTTLADEAGAMGNHWKRNIRMMAKVNEFAKKHNVVLDWTKGQGEVPDSATSIAGDEQPDEVPGR